MKIHLKNIKYYFLTHKNEIRRQHILSEFKDFDITEVNTIDDNRNQSATVGFSRVLDLACLNQERNKPFQPFVMFEDDVIKYREFPQTIEIPDNTDILYIGLSICGMLYDTSDDFVYYDNVNEDIVRTYNMLAVHGIIICSLRGLLIIQKCILEGYFRDIPWDAVIAQLHPFCNVYALRKPLVYQYGEIGGCEKATKIEYNNKEQKSSNLSWINKTNVTFKEKKLLFIYQEQLQPDEEAGDGTGLSFLS
jgi:hypothetical protein